MGEKTKGLPKDDEKKKKKKPKDDEKKKKNPISISGAGGGKHLQPYWFAIMLILRSFSQ
jgi:hypothetical protein